MTAIDTRLGRAGRRLMRIGAAAGAAWGLGGATSLLLLGAWLDLLWELSPALRIATLWAAGATGGLLLCTLAAAAVRAVRHAAVARRLDRAGGSGGSILTGWELEQGNWGMRQTGPAPSPQWHTSAGLASMAVDQAATIAGRVPLSAAAPLRPLGRALVALVVLWAVAGLLTVSLPGLASTQWKRFRHPFQDVPPFSLTRFHVTPGKCKVIYGNELEVRATVQGAPVEQLELVLETAHGQEQPLPMFPEADGVWRAVLSKVVEPGDYYVRAYRARSERYHIDVVTVPLIDGSRLRIVQPEYAGRAPYEGPMPRDGVSGLLGTKVQVFLHSNRPLGGGTIGLLVVQPAARESGVGSRESVQQSRVGRGTSPTKTQPEQRSDSPLAGPVRLPMKPAEPGSQEVAGEFTITGDGRFECRVIDEAGQSSQQTFSGNVVLLPDERPFVRITQPQKMSLATPTALLPVVISAEDDCGISRLQLFRSLNDSRFLAADLLPRSTGSQPADNTARMAVPRAPRRMDESVNLPLSRYGLAPGDVVKLFARVEDNDPAGAKGAESGVVTVQIISEAEFDRLTRARQGLEAMLSKYHDARRRMESLAKEVEELQQKLAGLPPDGKAAAETRRALERLARLMRQQAAAIREAAQRLTPYDLDQKLAPQLEQAAALSEAMAKELEKLLRERELINKKLAGKLDELAKRLAAGRKQFGERATQPLEYLEAVFPLIVDQQRFVMLVLWQQDLAERLSSLKGRDGEDSPSAKARMRDLEQEQQQVRNALATLLDDIQEHSEKLPELPELRELRETAQKFVGEVRGSGAVEAMTAAEQALAEFAPTRGYEKAKEAADILAKFLKRCHGMGNCADGALRFQPSLCQGMGNTVAQLLAGMGMGQGGGGGMGMSDGMGMGGYSSVGLYGGSPETFGAGERGAADSRFAEGAGASRRGTTRRGENPDARAGDGLAAGQAAGTSEGAVPARYRRQVGQYFRRVAEETGESGR